MSSKVWLSQKDAARVMGVTPKTLYRMRKKNRGPHCQRRNRSVIYSAASVHDWMDSQTIVA